MQLAIWEYVIRERGKLRLMAGLAAVAFCRLLAPEPSAAQNDSFFPTFSGSSEPATQPQPAPPTPEGASRLGGFPSEAGPALAPVAASYYSGYQLAAQDLLVISIWEAPEFSRAVRVAPDGTIRLPLLQNPVQVGGLTVLEAEQRIAQSLVDGGLLVDPIVAVTVTEFNGNPVRVSGAVRRPVIVRAIGPTTLLSAITEAGGIDTTRAGHEIVIEKPGAESVRFPTGEFIGGVNGVENYSLTGGETIRVEPAGTVIVFGAVSRSGEFPIPERDGMEFIELLSRVGGTQREAGGKAIVLRPTGGPGGGRERIEVSLKEVLKSEADVLRVQPGDVVYVPDSRLKRFAERFAEAAAFQFLLRLVIF